MLANRGTAGVEADPAIGEQLTNGVAGGGPEDRQRRGLRRDEREVDDGTASFELVRRSRASS